MEIKNYWWEDALVEALIENNNEYSSASDIILLVAKIIEAEKQNGSSTKK